MIPLTGDEWVISDTHFNHDVAWMSASRPDGWQETLIENWARLVAPTDVVIHLGDLELGTASEMDAVAPRLPGIKLLVPGNHDRRSVTRYRRWGFLPVTRRERYATTAGFSSRYRDKRGRDVLVHLCHEPIDMRDTVFTWTQVHGHLHVNGNHEAFDTGVPMVNVNPEYIGFAPIRLKDAVGRAKRYVP